MEQNRKAIVTKLDVRGKWKEKEVKYKERDSDRLKVSDTEKGRRGNEEERANEEEYETQGREIERETERKKERKRNSIMRK